ncbi:MAG: protein kinase [Actinobacteria bacterium]|nr:protein kinase [Actinomycetota bacterium]
MVAPEVLADRYRIDRQIGIGGMGTVFSAADERLQRNVAVKILKEELSSDPRFVERFRREARSAAALSHPNIASVFDYGEDSGRYFIVMELVEGRDLARVIREEGPFDAARATAFTAQIARALGHAHAGGLIHRDIKPHNVIVMDDDRVKVTDFGIARATGESTLTATGTVLGTAQYVSPEQASGETPGPPADVYSLGIVLFEMLTGAVPFTGDSPISVALRHVRDDVPPPSTIDPSVPKELDEIVARATAKQPDQRFANGDAFAAALTGEEAPPPTAQITAPGVAAATWPFTHPPRWDPTRLGRIVVLAFGALFLIALAALAYRLATVTEPIRERNRAAASPDATPTTAGFALADYRGRPADEAGAELQEAGLEPKFEPEVCEQEVGHICEQEPAPGAVVEQGDEVTLGVSTSENNEEEESDDDSEGDDKERGPPEHAKNKKKDKD